MEQDHSQQSWYPFFAYAELLVENSDVCLTTHVSELSRQGCHLHLTNRLPPATSVVVASELFSATLLGRYWVRGQGHDCFRRSRPSVQNAPRSERSHTARQPSGSLQS